MWTHTGALLLAWRVLAASAATRTYNLRLHQGERSPGQLPSHWVAIRPPSTADKTTDGFARQVYLINGQQSGPLIEADQGDTLEVNVFNDLDVENTIHWHGSCIVRVLLLPPASSSIALTRCVRQDCFNEAHRTWMVSQA